jgi:competence protein ComEC
VRGDFRLLIPALGIWAGAFFQSLLLGRAQWFSLSLLFLIAISVRRAQYGTILAACFVGALTLALHQSALHKEFFEERDGQVVKAELSISSDARKLIGKIYGDFRQSDRYLIEVKSIEIDSIKLSVPLILVGGSELADLNPSSVIELFARVRIAEGYSTIAGSLTQVGDITRKEYSSFLWRHTSAIRKDIKSAVKPLPSDARALIPGLVVGDRSGQDEDLTDAMQRSGLTHLTAVSGANFAIVAALLLAIGRALRVRGKFLWWGIALLLALFIFLVRPSSSVLRAAVMTGVLLFARARGVRASPVPALAAAISLLLLVNPFFVRDAGFGLSVLATSGLLFLAPAIHQRCMARGIPSLLAEGLAIPISATVFCLPLVVLLSGELSIISIFANFLVAPVIAIITACGILLMLAAPFSNLLATLVGWLITPFALWITFIARTFAELPFAALKWPKSWLGSLAAIAALFTLLVIIEIKRTHFRRLILVTIALILACEIALTVKPLSKSWVPSDWSIFQCDVGQGDALVVRTGQQRAILIDVGPEPSAIDRCLKLLEVRRIDLLVLTHYHADHVAGLAGALKERRVDGVWSSFSKEPAQEFAQAEKLLADIPRTSPQPGVRYESEQVRIQVVVAADDLSPNDSSIAIIGSGRGLTFFAAGDLELTGQARAVVALRRMRSLDIWDGAAIDFMKATHHGSALQEPELLELLRPRTTFVSVGVGNPYGHPTQSALELYRRHGSIFRTDTDRSLALVERGGNLIVVAQPPSPWAL